MQIKASHIESIIQALGYGGKITFQDILLPIEPTLNDILELSFVLECDPQKIIDSAISLVADAVVDSKSIHGLNAKDVIETICDVPEGFNWSKNLIKNAKVSYHIYLMWIQRCFAEADTVTDYVKYVNRVGGTLRNNQLNADPPERNLHLFCTFANRNATEFIALMNAPLRDAIMYHNLNELTGQWLQKCAEVDSERITDAMGVKYG